MFFHVNKGAGMENGETLIYESNGKWYESPGYIDGFEREITGRIVTAETTGDGTAVYNKSNGVI